MTIVPALIVLVTLSVMGSSSIATSPALGKPAGAQAGSEGCLSLRVYTWDEARTAAIVVEVDQARVQLGPKPLALDLSQPRAGVQVHRDLYSEPIGAFDYCNDLKLPLSLKLGRAEAVAGRLIISVDDRSQATARLEGVVFEGLDRSRMTVPGPLTMVTRVGWFPGRAVH